MNLFIDIETLPTENPFVLDRIRKSITAPSQYKKPESIAQWMADNLEAETVLAASKTALDGTWGRIACIGWAIDDGPVMVTQYGTEADTLDCWATDLQEYVRQSDDPRWYTRLNWVGHNLINFDLRFLWQRSRVLNIKLDFPLPVEKFSKNVYDTMVEWCGYGKYVKQTDLELAFGIERDDKITGAEVATASPFEIAQHCQEDVRCLREIYRRMVQA
jgi:hypothetical protein